MLSPQWSRKDILYFALIGFAEVLIFFNNPGHFFMGDTLYWMGNRYHSFTEFLRGFIAADPTLWYRPLAQRTLESLLFPVFGLSPIPYHVAMFVLFFGCTIAVFLVAAQLAESRRVAWIATFFFATQVTHAFTTFDAAFVPEILFTLFFIGSVMFWVAWFRTGNRKAIIVSVAFFVGSLLSKETAVALPFTLFAIWLALRKENKTRLRGVRSLAPHFAVLAAYLIFTIGFIHIRGIDVRQLIEKPGTAGQDTYRLVLGKNILDSTSVAFSWAFGIPRNNGMWLLFAPKRIFFLRTLRILTFVAALLVLLTRRRKYLLIGLAWFLITASPTLPLVDHFLPYYLFAPLVGFSIAVGVMIDWLYESCARFAPSLALPVCAGLMAVVAIINANNAIRVARTSGLLGISAENARNGVNDLLALFPSLPKGAKLVILDQENPALFWDQANGMLFRMAYGDETIQTQYLSQGGSISEEDVKAGNAFVFKWTGGHLVKSSLDSEK